jgi:NAD(P)-dependent dehydrogenase (short-subunit alcohol dehydrogenase family)
MTNDTIKRRQMLTGALAAGFATAALSKVSQAQETASSGVLAGKVAIVAGARNNLGRGFAATLGGMGASVLVHHHLAASRPEAEETAQLVVKAGGKAEIFAGDLTNSDTMKAMFDAAQTTFGGVDIAITTVGKIIKKPLAQFTNEEFDLLDATNNKSMFYFLRESATRVRDGGRIILTGTSLLAGSAPGYAIYAGTKAPVEEYTRMLAKELGAKRITVNNIGPGPLDTPFFHGAETPQSTAFATGLSTEKRLGKVEDINPMVAFLASPDSQWVNGQSLWVNGAYLTR